jgi:Pentapeptide repeats (9 copies)
MALQQGSIFDFGPDWLTSLFAKLAEIRASRAKELSSIASVFGDPERLARYYIEPDCQQFNPADFESELTTVVREPIFSRIQTFLEYSTPTGPKTLLILSDAGMGKTSALVMLKLTHLMAFWPRSYKCSLLKLGGSSLTEIEKIERKHETVLLLDALDEDPTAWTRVHARLRDILNATTAFRSVVITCRTQFFSGGDDPFRRRGVTSIEGFPCAIIYNSLLSDRQVLQYINKRAEEQIDSIGWRTKAIAIVERMGHLRMRPMLLAHLDDLIESTLDIWDEYSLYQALVQSWLTRERTKRLEVSDQIPTVSTLLQACEMLAIAMHKKGQSVISPVELQVHSQILSTLEPILAQHLGGRSLLNRNSEGMFRFSHYSIQEFLIVNHQLTDGPLAGKSSVRTTDAMLTMLRAWLSHATPEQKSAAVLSSFSFEKTRLDNFDFSHCTLSENSFSGSQLLNVRFNFSFLSGADLTRAGLNGCDFRNARFLSCDFEHATVRSSSFSNAELLAVNLKSAKIESCTFWNTKVNSKTIFPVDFSLESGSGKKFIQISSPS